MTLIGVLLTGGLVGCQSESLRPEPIKQPSDLYWSLDLNHRAVLMSTTAPYDTLTLTAVPRNYRGEALSGLSTPTYTSSDPDFVTVTAGGLLVAKRPTAGTTQGYVVITARLTTDTLTHEDQVTVEVVDNPSPPRLASFSVHPIPPDSAKAASLGAPGGNTLIPLFFQFLTGNLKRIIIHAFDSTGAAMPHLPVSYRVLDSTVVNELRSFDGEGILRDSAFVAGGLPGTVPVYVSTTAFGIAKADTLTFRIGWPLFSAVAVAAHGGTFDTPEIRIGTGGVVAWYSNLESPDTAEVTFADPTNVVAVVDPTPDSAATGMYQFLCNPNSVFYSTVVKELVFSRSVNAWSCTAPGNFKLEPGSLSVDPENSAAHYYPPAVASRRFPVPGTYEYTNTRTGAQGRIVVVDER